MKNNIWNPLKWPQLLFDFAKDIYQFVSHNVYESIRLQLILTFVICSIAALSVIAISNSFFMELNRRPWIDYSASIRSIDGTARSILYSIQNEMKHQDRSYNDELDVEQPPVYRSEQERIERLIQTESNRHSNIKILILDLDGKVLYKSENATETEVDLHSIIRNAMDVRYEGDLTNGKEYNSFYPINLEKTKAYLVVAGMPQPQINYVYENSAMPYLLALIIFVALFYMLTKKKMKYIQELAGALLEISKGNLAYRTVQKGGDELGSLASSINYMAEQLQIKEAEERKAEKIKNELITNVSHDLRTPLTLIMGYLRLLKDKNFGDEQQADHYISIAYSKSEKLKVLMDDLFEYTKLSNEGVKLIQEKVNLNELLEQLLEELVSYAEDNQMTIKKAISHEKLLVMVDPDKITRVFENLLTNAIKYSHKPGEIKVLLYRDSDYVKVCFINKADPVSEEDLTRLFERFYRIDRSRSSETGGSGLGLAISKSIIDYHKGDIWVEADGDEVRFWVKLKLHI